ncbi:MAG: right-handed parallel beta-helix repeat-containing protein [Bacteroidia bacterium]|nr:right-handed parallel beta-helix repeat-containing protein [Bacteroidia bacterium]
MFEGKKIYYTENGGLSFTNITYDLPNIPVNCILYDPDNERLYIGTDAGIYFKEDGTTTWLEDGNLPYRMIITDMKLNKVSNKIMISTWGHGLWEGEIVCNYVNNELVINTNTVWNCDKRLNRKVRINNNATLTIINSNVLFHNEAGIIIEHGSKLILDGGRLTNFCGDMWQGIEVYGNTSLPQTEANQGVIELLNGAVIENAECGVLLGRTKAGGYYLSSSGGIIEADETCTFKNNRVAIRFTDYANENISYIYGCSFITDNAMIHPEIADTFIVMRNVRGVEINGCTFRNDSPDDFAYSKRGTGIKGIGSQFTVDKYIASETEYQSKFENLYRGIYASNYNSMVSISITNTRFINNDRGIYISSVNYPVIKFNEFDVKQASTQPAYGLYLYNSKGFSVENNDFTSSDHTGNYGIYVYNSKDIAALIYKNDFSFLNKGIQTAGVNKRLQIRCNTFTDMHADDVNIAITGTITTKLGTCYTHSSAANNIFTVSCGDMEIYRDIWTNPGVNFFNYSYQHSEEYNLSPDCYNPQKILLWECQTDFDPAVSCPDLVAFSPLILIATINSAKETLTALPKIDAGNTQALLNIVYSNQPPGKIKNKLLGLYLSDTVLIAVVKRPGKPPLPPGIVKEIIIPNSPVTAKVKQAIDTRVPALPTGILTEINNVQTGTSAREELENQIAYYEEQKGAATNELIQCYLFDTTIVNGMDSLIAFLAVQPDISSKQLLIQAYLLTEQCNQAKTFLNQLPQQTDEDLYFYKFFNLLADKCIAGESIYDLPPAQEQIIRNVLNSGTTTVANAQALLTLVFGEYFPEIFEPLIAPDSLNITGILLSDSTCGSVAIANAKVFILNSDSTLANIRPALTDASGNFRVNYFDLLQLNDTALCAFGLSDGVALSHPVTDFRAISEWLDASPVTLRLSLPEASVALADSILCFGDSVLFCFFGLRRDFALYIPVVVR